MNHTYFLNGRAVDGKAALAAFGPENQGVFETVRVYHGKIFREEEHWERLRESVQTAGLSGVFDFKALRRAVHQAIKAYGQPEAAVRVTWASNAGLLVMAGQRRLPQELYKAGMALKTSCVRRSHSNAAPPEAKTTDYMNAVMATLEPAAGEEWLFLDQQGFVTEVRTGNIFIIDFSSRIPRLRTPPLRGILNGVTRRFVIECALLEGLEVREEPLTRHDIYNAAEAFLTNTSWEILPVRSLDGRFIDWRLYAGTGKAGRSFPGQITQRLHRRFKKEVLKECPK